MAIIICIQIILDEFKNFLNISMKLIIYVIANISIIDADLGQIGENNLNKFIVRNYFNQVLFKKLYLINFTRIHITVIHLFNFHFKRYLVFAQLYCIFY